MEMVEAKAGANHHRPEGRASTPHILFVTLAVMQFSSVVWSAYASVVVLLFALAFTMARSTTRSRSTI
jgi:hypothetical protein